MPSKTPSPNDSPPIAAITSDARYTAAMGVLRALQDGAAQIQHELDSIRISRYLRVQPHGQNAELLRERLKKNPFTSKKPSTEQMSNPDVPPAVDAALKLLQAGSSREPRPDDGKRIRRLEDDAVVLLAGIMAQHAVIDELRNMLSGALAARLRNRHRKLVLEHFFRAAQSFAAAGDALRGLRSEVLTAGFNFHSDALPEPNFRSALCLGSENDPNSEISRTRRLFEELKIL